MEESFLWNKFRSGDKNAIETIYFLHYEKLIKYGIKFTNDIYLLEDCIHDLFVYLIRNSATLGPTDNIAFYLFKSLRRLITKTKSSSKFNFDYNLVLQDFINKEPCYNDNNFTNILEPTQLFEVLNELPERQKEIIYLKYCNDLSSQEIADILEIKNQTVRNLLCRGLKLLRKKLDAKNVFNNILLPYAIIIIMLRSFLN